MDRVLPMVQGTMAFTDAFQVPLVIAVIYSVKLSRRWGRAWKGIGVAFAGYTTWVIVTAFMVGFSPSGYLLITLGTLLDPTEPMWKATSNVRIWSLGIAGTILVFWAVPTGLAWLLRQRRPVPTPPVRPVGPWAPSAIAGLLLLAGQQLLFTYANRLGTEERSLGHPPSALVVSSILWGVAAASTLPIVVLLTTGLLRWVRRPSDK